jgi:hypothetical protein
MACARFSTCSFESRLPTWLLAVSSPIPRLAAYGREQDLESGILADVPDGAGPQHTHHPCLIERRRQGDDADMGCLLDDPLCRPDAVEPARHQEILQHDKRFPLVELREQLFAACRHADHSQVGKGLEVRLEAARDDAVVIDERDGNHVHAVASSRSSRLLAPRYMAK